jgi:hypothetical protein
MQLISIYHQSTNVACNQEKAILLPCDLFQALGTQIAHMQCSCRTGQSPMSGSTKGSEPSGADSEPYASYALASTLVLKPRHIGDKKRSWNIAPGLEIDLRTIESDLRRWKDGSRRFEPDWVLCIDRRIDMRQNQAADLGRARD